MNIHLYILVYFLLATGAFAVPPITWEKLDAVIDPRTVRLVNAKGETNVLTLACIGSVANEKAVTTLIRNILVDRRLRYWPLDTTETNWTRRPMCLFYGFENGRGSVVYDFPMLNEEILRLGLSTFRDEQVVSDRFGLKDRLRRASGVSLHTGLQSQQSTNSLLR